MYLRTLTRKNKNGSIVKYYQLAHNERNPRTKKPVPLIIHNFGRADELDRNAMVRLCKSIARICDLEIVDKHLESTAGESATISGTPSRIKEADLHAFYNKELSELKAKVAVLQESEKKFKTFFENANDEIVYVDTEGKIIEVNEATRDILGWTREETIGKYFNELGLFKPEDAKLLADNFKHSFEKIPLQVTEIEVFRKDGTPVFIEVNAKLLEIDGKVKGILNIIRDITDRKRAEFALQESEEMARALLNATTDAVLLLNKDGIILDLNEAYAQRFNRAIDEVVGRCLWDLIPGELSAYRDVSRKVLQTGNSVRFELEFLGMWNDHVVYPVLELNGKVSRIAVFSHDITKRKQAEDALTKHRDDLENLVNKRTRNLEEANTALKVLLEKREEDKSETEEKILLNVKELVMPSLEEMKTGRLDDRQKALADILEYNLNNIISPFVRELSSKYLALTPMEIRIASFIKQGKTTKEIAEILKMSSRTIDNHRYSIRKKFGINNKRASLATYLMSLK